MPPVDVPAMGQGNVLEGYDFSKIPFGSAEHIHLFVEAKKLAFADRARFYAAPPFSQAPVPRLISKECAAQRRALISLDKALKEVQPGTPKQLEEGDTVYMTVADANGMMVSLIQSKYRGMGSGVAPPGLGFILNLQEAGDAPRIQHEGSAEPTGQATAMSDGGEVNLETGFTYETMCSLMRKGHRVVFADGAYGGYQAIMRDPVAVFTTAHPRALRTGRRQGIDVAS